jgi:hypothetical protein
VHNEGRYLDATIRSVLSQTYTSFDLVISCNGCTDDSLQIAEKYASLDRRVRVLVTPDIFPSAVHWRWILPQIKDRGYSYGIHLGGHDIISTGYLDVLVREMSRNPGYALCYPEEAYAIDEFDRIKFRYPPMPQTFNGGDIFQVISVILSLRYNILAFGLNRIDEFLMPVLRDCYAFDHIKTGSTARKGILKSVHGAQLLLRDTSKGLQQYTAKHFGKTDLDVNRGIAEQLELVDGLLSGLLPTNNADLNNAVRISVFTLYIVRYAEQFGGDPHKIKDFFSNPEISSVLVGQSRLAEIMEKWVSARLAPHPIKAS